MTYSVKLRTFDTRFAGLMHKLQHPHQLLAFGSFVDSNPLHAHQDISEVRKIQQVIFAVLASTCHLQQHPDICLDLKLNIKGQTFFSLF